MQKARALLDQLKFGSPDWLAPPIVVPAPLMVMVPFSWQVRDARGILQLGGRNPVKATRNTSDFLGEHGKPIWLRAGVRSSV